MPELLSPAGNYEKMVAAIRFGADAVYLAGPGFGMRAAAGNFTLEELGRAVAYAHARGVRVYLTVNTMPREWEYPALRDYFAALAPIGVDALIIADIGVLFLAREMLPGCELHMSTQANSVSAAACRAWASLGVRRVVLSRELTLEEIARIRRELPPDIEIECFVHGSMCISYSGRCLLSNYLCGRDANHGACAQPCRWNYRLIRAEVLEEKRPEEPIEIQEAAGETFVMSSRDLSMIDHVAELIRCGVDSFKIEGRMKSAYYTAVVTNAYRMAIDAALAGRTEPDPAWQRELGSVSHREYDTGYFYCSAGENALTCARGGYIREKAYLATVLSYDEGTGRALCFQRNKMSVGDAVECLSPGRVGRAFVCGGLWDEAGEPVSSVPHPQTRFYLSVPFPVGEGDIIRGGNSDGIC